MKRFMIKKDLWLKIIKIAAGSCIAILIADFLGLSYSASAGIITLLSIQDTKKETLKVAAKRFAAFLLSVLLALSVFLTAGYHPLAYGVFLLFFVALSYLLRLTEGIPMCSVLASHFLIERNMSVAFIGNEAAILAIGIATGVLLNLYMPDNTDAVIKDMRLLEDELKEVLKEMASCLKSGKETPEGLTGESGNTHECICLNGSIHTVFEQMEKHIKQAEKQAYDNMNNNLLTDTRYYIGYFNMRKEQLLVLRQIGAQIAQLTAIPKQAYPICYLLEKIREQFHESNNARELLRELTELWGIFKAEPVPSHREEFENRAVLYSIMNNLESFLIIKRDFVDNISEKQIRRFWGQKNR